MKLYPFNVFLLSINFSSRWGPLEVYRKNRSKYLLAITYEDLQSNPEEEIKKLLSVLNIDPNNTGLALKALEV